MSAFRATVVLAVLGAAACGAGDSDINLAGTITSAATQSAIVDAEVAMYYRTVSQLDPGVVLARSDTAGHYTLHGREAPCTGLSLRVTATGFQPSMPVTPQCHKAVQQIDFALQP